MPFRHSRLIETISALEATASTPPPVDPSPYTKSATRKTPQKTPFHTTRDFLSRDVLTFPSYAPPSPDLQPTTPISASKRDDRPSHLSRPFLHIQHPRSPSIENAKTRETAHLKLLDTLFLVIYSHFGVTHNIYPLSDHRHRFSPLKPVTIPPPPPPPPRAHFISRQLHESAVKNYAVTTIRN